MPYKIVQVSNGFKVKKDQIGRPKYFSKHILTYDKALSQLRALQINTK